MKSFFGTDAAMLESEIVNKQQLVRVGLSKRFCGNHPCQAGVSLMEVNTPTTETMLG